MLKTSEVIAVAAKSKVARYSWRDRGVAPTGFTKGMAATFEYVYRKLRAGDPAAKAMVRIVEDGHDVFDANADLIRTAGFKTDAPEAERLRLLFVILFGLGMRESSGRYCCGRDTTAAIPPSSITVETGLFQQSWDSNGASPEIARLMDADAEPTFLDIFKEGVTPRGHDLENWGTGDGRDFQAACKANPRFAVEVAALGVRTRCNAWGPINREEVELVQAADDLFLEIQGIVNADIGKPGTPTPAASKGFWATVFGMVAKLLNKSPANPSTSPPVAPPKPADATPWMTWAVGELGFHEKGVNLGIEKYIDLSKNGSRATLLGEPWCADFSNAAFEAVGIRGTRSAMARSYEDSPYFVELDGPAYGAVVTMWRGSPTDGAGHVFFYTGQNEQGVWGVGGNQSDSVSNEPHQRNRIVGYFWPKSVPLPEIKKIIVTGNGAKQGTET